MGANGFRLAASPDHHNGPQVGRGRRLGCVTKRQLSSQIEYSQPVLQEHFTGMEQIAGAIASPEFIKPLPDKVFRATLHAADVLLVNEKLSRSGCQLMTVKSRTAHASDSEWSELCWASSGRTVSSPRCGRRG